MKGDEGTMSQLAPLLGRVAGRGRGELPLILCYCGDKKKRRGKIGQRGGKNQKL